MLDKNVFFNKMDQLVSFYPNWRIDFNNKDVIKAWYKMFKHMTDDHFIKMVDKYIENEQFNPTVAGLKSWDVEPRKTVDQKRHEKALEEHGYT